jgi:hypothetical protein
MHIDSPEPDDVAAVTPGGGDGTWTGRALATVLGWHALAAAAFVGWVLTLPDEVSAGGELGLTMSRWFLAFLLGVLLVAPGLCASAAVACGVLAVLRRWRRGWSGLLAGTVATLAGMAAVVCALAVYALTRR